MSTALPHLARIDEAPRIHGLPWASREESGLKDTFNDASHMKWVRERCAADEVWVVDREEAIASVMMLRPEDRYVRYVATDKQSRRGGLARAPVQHVRSLYTGLWAKAMLSNANAISLRKREGFGCSEHLDTEKYIAFEWGAGRRIPTIGPDWRIWPNQGRPGAQNPNERK